MNIPVLILAYNRPQITLDLIQQLKSNSDYQLHLSLDGARTHHDYIAQNELLTRLPSDVKVNHFSKNLGCRDGVNAGLDWFFSINDFGMIIEDDITITPNGLKFLETEITNVNNTQFLISACNILDAWGLYFSSNNILLEWPQIWGWSTTATNWFSFRNWSIPNYRTFRKRISRYNYWERCLLKRIYNFEQSEIIDTWDYRLALYFACEEKISIIPSRNYVRNLDISGGTHGDGREFEMMRTTNLPPSNSINFDSRYQDLFMKKIQKATAINHLLSLFRHE